MLYAIVSDIHGNYNAWAAVLDEIQDVGADRIVCLGDVVGYGPEPARCVQSVKDVAYACILGNHDAVVAKKFDSTAFNDHARKLIEWTGLQLNPEEMEFLAGLDYEFHEDCFRCVHGDCDNPEEFNYIIDCNDARLSWNKTDEQIIFCGHSHLPAIFVSNKEGSEMCSLSAQDFTAEEKNRYIVNVGSVGSPRDDDLRASYVLFDSETKSVFFRRICYDFNEFRDRVHFVGLNDCDVPLLCYVLEEETPTQILLEEDISKVEIVISNETSDLAKTVCLHQIDLPEMLKKSSATKFLQNQFRDGIKSNKRQIKLNKKDIEASLHKREKAILMPKSSANIAKKSREKIDEDDNESKSDAPKRFSVRRLKDIAIGVAISLLLLILVGVFFQNTEGEEDSIRYYKGELAVLKRDDLSARDNLLPEIWMNSDNFLDPYHLTVSKNISVCFDNIDGMYGSELILQNTSNRNSQFCFETPYVELDANGKYLILAKVFLSDCVGDKNISLRFVCAKDDNLATALPREDAVKFNKREIAKKLYKKENIPSCFKYRPSKAGWWLAQKTIEGKELDKYIRIIISGDFGGRISIGGVSIQRID